MPGIFGAQTGLNGTTPWRDVGKFIERRQFTRRQLDHPAYEVDAVDQFGDAMLDLQPRVDLEEGRLLALGVVEELHRACALVVHPAQQRLGFGLHAPTHVRR